MIKNRSHFLSSICLEHDFWAQENKTSKQEQLLFILLIKSYTFIMKNHLQRQTEVLEKNHLHKELVEPYSLLLFQKDSHKGLQF